MYHIVSIFIFFNFSSKIRNNCVGIDLFRLQFPLMKLWEVTSKCVSYVTENALLHASD